MNRLFYSLLLLLAVTATVAGQTSGWTPELALTVKQVGDVRVSPDGSRVAFVVRISRTEGELSDWQPQIHLSRADGTDSFQLTAGEKGSSSPRWSPDGRSIAFLSSRGGKSSIWLIRVDGGEARKISDEKSGISSFQWSPDGSQISFTMTDPMTDEEEKDKKERRDARVVDENYKMTGLYVLAVTPDDQPGESRRLSHETVHVAAGFFGAAFDWAPDGRRIAFAHQPTPLINDWPKGDISTVDVASGRVSRLVHTAAAEGQPVYSPDGRWISYRASDDPPTWAFSSQVMLVTPDGEEGPKLATTFDQQPSILGWTSDGRSMLLAETKGTISRLIRLPASGEPAQDYGPEGLMIGGANLNYAGTHVGFVSQDAATAPEAFSSSVTSFKPTQVSHVQDLPELRIGRTEPIQWASKDGMQVEGLLTYPVGYRSGQRVPMVVIVHGGPTGVFTQGFIATRGAYPIAAFADRGYAVLRCNPRGSSGYGQKFRYANYDDWGGGDYQDIMSGVDHVIGMGVADANRLGIMGWSYGGYMTSWVVTQANRFKAASVGAGVTNLMSFTGTSDVPGFVPDYFSGEYWETFDAWRAHSAMFQVGGVETPTMVQHGEQDVRVPISQGYEFYNALKRQNVPTKMVVYPRQPHGIQEPKLQLAAMKANLDWFDKWLK